MIRRAHFINKIRELGYTFKVEKKRVYIWRKIGGTHFILVPKASLLDEDLVISALRQTDASEGEIQSFISSAKN